MKATEELFEILREFYPFVKIVDNNHRLGTLIEIDKTQLKYKPNKYRYEWKHAGKYAPSHFTLVFAGFDKDINLRVDNFCNIVEEGDFSYDRGECTMVIADNGDIVEIYDLQ